MSQFIRKIKSIFYTILRKVLRTLIAFTHKLIPHINNLNLYLINDNKFI